LPDLAEIISIARLREISLAVGNVYSPGLKIIVLLDGVRFENICYFDKKKIISYQDKMFDFLALMNDGDEVSFFDYVGLLKRKLPVDVLVLMEKNKKDFAQYYYKKMGKMIDKRNPKRYLEELKNASSSDIKKIIDLFYSLIYSINFPEINKDNSDELAKKIFKDPFDLNIKSKATKKLRNLLLERAWDCCINYAAEISAGRMVKPAELIFPDAIKCDMHMIPERYTFYSVDRSTTLTAFHGVGYVNEDGIMGVKFRCQLLGVGYQPVYVKGSKTYPYENQAFFYVPKKIKNNKMLHDLIGKSRPR
jgi:hypothetical protein